MASCLACRSVAWWRLARAHVELAVEASVPMVVGDRLARVPVEEVRAPALGQRVAYCMP